MNADNTDSVNLPTPEVAALRRALLALGVVVRDTDRWSGIEVGERKTFLDAADRGFFDFLPTAGNQPSVKLPTT